MRNHPSNETREAYTGNYSVRKGIRISLKQFSLVSACVVNTVGDYVNIMGSQYKETIKIEIEIRRHGSSSNRQGFGGAVGVKEHGMSREKH